ncbi:hypothetical protein OG204_17125 [Streptomyces sp. NBC_01387]|uniref:hypothetical protein n=1 Tax=Streptomyces sp. NBC_01387 TaxID=2903849 RepID=UPI003249802A
MPSERIPSTGQLAADAAQLAALVRAGGFWRLAPAWLPRTGYAPLTQDVLREVVTGLERQLDRMDEQPELESSVLKWPPCRCGRPVCPDAPKADADAVADTVANPEESPTLARLRVRLREGRETRA